MKSLNFRQVTVFLLSLLVVGLPALTHAQLQQTQVGPPSVGGPLVREGDFAVSLAAALSVVTTDDEVEAESRLGGVGVVPRNGWIADYPVTPDIIGELQKAVDHAADARKLSLSRDDSLQRLNNVASDLGVSVRPYTSGVSQAQPEAAENYPNPEDINDYYDSEGPPVVTYYAPPPDYYALYAFVPYPFWCYGFWFPGFFVLHDFHRIIFFHNRARFVSNHFNDARIHRMFRVDPTARFNGRTFAGVGAPRTGAFISTGIPKSNTRIFNAPPVRMPSSQMVSPSSGWRRVEPSPSSGSKVISPLPGGSRTVNQPSNESRMVSPSSRGGGTASPSFRGQGVTAPSGVSRTVNPPSNESRMVSPSSRGGGTASPSFRGQGVTAPSGGGVSGPSHGSGGSSGGGHGGGGHGR